MPNHTGAFAKKILKMQQSGRDDAPRLLHEKLKESSKATSPMQAAKAIAKDIIDDLKAGFDDYAQKNQQAAIPLSALKNLDLTITTNHTAMTTIAADLVDKGLTSQETAVQIRRKLWIDTLKNHPDATPKELSNAYTQSLTDIHQSLLAARPHANSTLLELEEYLSPDRAAVNPTTKKGLTQTFEELQTAAEQSDIPTAVARLDKQIELLQKAKESVTQEIDVLRRESSTTKDSAKKAQLDTRIERLEKVLHNPDFDKVATIQQHTQLQAQIDALETRLESIDPKLSLPERSYAKHQLETAITECRTELNALRAKTSGIDDKIAMLEAQKAVLEKQKDRNPVTGNAARLAVQHANEYAEHSNVAPRIAAEKAANYKEINTDALRGVVAAYKDNTNTGTLLKELDNNIDALNKATAKLNALLAQSVTPEARRANQAAILEANKAINTCCKSIAEQLNGPGGSLIVQAFAEQDKLEALNTMTEELTELDHTNAALSGSKKNPGEFIRPLASNAINMEPEEVKKQTGKNAESMQKYYGLTHEVWNSEKAKLETVPVMGSDGKPIKLNYEEAAALVAKFNKEHPDLRPPVTINKKANGGYHIECHNAQTKGLVITEMKKIHDKRAAAEAKALTETKVEDHGAVTESATSKKEDAKKGAETGPADDNFTPMAATGPATTGETDSEKANHTPKATV